MTEADEDDEPLALDFHAWATLSARMVKQKPMARAKILEQAKLDDDAWSRCDEHYSALLAADLERGDLARAESYGARCAEELTGRVADAAPTQSHEAPVPSPTIRAPELPPLAPPVPATPTYLTPAAAPPAPPMRPPPATVFDGTTMAPSFTPSAPLPFVPAPAFAPPSKPAAPPPSRHAANERLGSGTVSIAEGSDAPLPFAQRDPCVVLTLEQYASFRAELGVFPDRRAEILVRYHVVHEQARRDLDEAWRKRFAADRPLQQRFLQLSVQYRDYLLQHKGK